jgi:hypothetical protein
MTIDLNRRTFLIGSAAFVAAAAAPPLPPGLQRSAAVLTSRFPYRAVYDLELSFDLDASDPMRDQMGIIEFGCAGEERPHHVGMNMRSFYRWRAMDGAEKILTEQRGLVVNVWPAVARARIGMFYNVERDPKKRSKMFCEQLTWNGPGDIVCSEPLPLDVRDSNYDPNPGWFSRLLGFFKREPDGRDDYLDDKYAEYDEGLDPKEDYDDESKT